MKEQILNWLKYDRSFDAGFRLYVRYGHSLSLKTVFNRQGDTTYNSALLCDALAKLAGVNIAELAVITAKPVLQYSPQKPIVKQQIPETPIFSQPPGEPEDETPVIYAESQKLEEIVPRVVIYAIKLRDEFPFLSAKDCPVELKILVADMLSAHDTFKKSHEQLFSAENEQSLLSLSKATVEGYLENRAIWDELNYFKENGSMKGEHSIFAEMDQIRNLKSLSAGDLAKKKHSVSTKIARLKKKLIDQTHPEKTAVYTEDLSSNERILLEIEKLLQLR